MRTAPPAKGRVGRRSKLTPARVERVCSYLRAGHFIATASRLSGISEATYHAWVTRGLERPGSAFSEFLESTRAARAQAEHDALAVVQAATRAWTQRVVRWVKVRGREVEESTIRELPGDWRAAAWFLERARPERYGRRRCLAHEGAGHVKRLVLVTKGAGKAAPPAPIPAARE